MAPNREHPGARRWLEEAIAGTQAAGARGEPGQPRWSRELLELDLLLAADVLARQQRFEPVERGQRFLRRRAERQVGVILEPQHLGKLERGVRIAHAPAAFRVAAAEMLGQDAIERLPVDALASLDPGGERTGGQKYQRLGNGWERERERRLGEHR